MNKNLISAWICIIFISSMIFGCTKKSPETGKVVATINGEPIYVSDINQSLALNVKRDPMFRITPETLDTQLNILVDKKLLIQEAKKRALDQNERFIKTIQAFWEQTLIRDLIADEDMKLSESVKISKKEIDEYYNKLKSDRLFSIIQSKNRALIEEIVNKNPDDIEWDEEIGPICYEDVNSPVLLMAFDIPLREKRVIMDRGMYYLVYVKEIRDKEIEPFDEIKQKIEERLKNIKKQRNFNAWLAEIRKNADVKIRSDELKNISYAGKET